MAGSNSTGSLKVCGIYRIYAIASGVSYIGSSSDIHKRWNSHRSYLRRGSHHSPYLQRAWFKYGEAAFSIEVVEVVASADLLAERETHYIDVFGSVAPSGYNFAPAGGSTLGVKLGPHSDEHRRKIAEAHIGKKVSAETKSKLSKIRKGMKLTPEWRAKIAAAALGGKRGPLTPEHKAKISAVHKGKKISEAQRIAMSKASKGRPQSEETRRRRSASITAWWQTRRDKGNSPQMALDL